jgi:hypothetical protein
VIEAALPLVGIAIAIFATGLSVRCWLKLSTRPPAATELKELRSQVRQLDLDMDDLFDRMKRLATRKGMRAKRDADAEQFASGKQMPGETAAEWKQRMRKQRANGGIAHEGEA